MFKFLFNRNVTAVEEPTEPTPPKPKNVLMGIIVINNKTEKEYQYRSTNDFGLSWKSSEYNNISIRQNNSGDGDLWAVLAIFNLNDYSIVRVEREEKML